MKKYLIEYQVDEDEPTHCVIESYDEQGALGNLDNKIAREYKKYGLEKEEVDVLEINILEVTKV